MLTCLPQSICSWDFLIQGASRNLLVEFDFFTEQGRIFYGGREFAVVKHGWMSGQWTLERDGVVHATAEKPNAFFRTFEIEAEGQRVTLQAQNPFTRCFDLLVNDRDVGDIRPDHPFTRRAVIDCPSSVPELTQVFAFWLAVLAWRRASRNNNSAST